MIPAARVSVWKGDYSSCVVRDAAYTDLMGGRIEYEDTPAGCGAATIILGQRYEEVFARGYWVAPNIVEISTADDALAQATTVNVATDTDGLSTWTKTVNMHLGAFGPGTPPATVAYYTGTGGASGSEYLYELVTVVPGFQYVFSWWVNPSAVTSGSLALQIDHADLSAAYLTATIPFGAAKRYTVGPWTAPAGVTQIALVASTNNATITSGSVASFGMPMGEPSRSVASPWYVPGGSAVRLYVGSTLPYDTAQGEDTQQLFLDDGVLTMGIPVLGVGVDSASSQPYVTVANTTVTMPGNPATLTAHSYGVGALVGRRRYAGVIKMRDRPNGKYPYATISCGPLSDALSEAFGGYTIGAALSVDVTTAIYSFLTGNGFPVSHFPHLVLAAGNFAAMTGSLFSGTRQNASCLDMITDAIGAISSGDRWFVRVGHDRTPRLIKLYDSASNTYTYTVSLAQGATTFEPLIVDFADQDTSTYYNQILVMGNTNPATQQPYSAIVVDGNLAAASALTSGTSAGTLTVLSVTAGTGTLFVAGAPVTIDVGGSLDTTTVISSTANTVTVATTAHNHLTGAAVNQLASGAVGLAGRYVDGAPVTVTQLTSDAACAAYARGLLNQYSIGRSHGTFRTHTRNDVTPDQAPQGIANGDCVRAVSCVTITGFDGVGTSQNFAADSEILSPSTWTISSGLAVAFNATDGLNAISVSASAAGTKTADGPRVWGAGAGRAFRLSALMDASTMTGGSLSCSIVTDQGVVSGSTITATNGAARTRYTSALFTLPANILWYNVRWTSTNAVFASGNPLFDAPLLAQNGTPSTYVPCYGAPNVFGLCSSVVSVVDFAELDRYQNVSFSAVMPDWTATLEEQVNAAASSLHANTPTSASITSYIVSAAAFPPTISTGSLMVGTPAFLAQFAAGASPISIAANASSFTLPASQTSWVWLNPGGSWTINGTPSSVAGAIPYGYFTTSATGVLGFTALASIGVIIITNAQMPTLSGPTMTISSASVNSAGYTAGATTYKAQVTFTVAISPDPSAGGKEIDLVICDPGTFNTGIAQLGGYPIVGVIPAPVAGPTTYTNLNLSGFPAGRPYEIHAILWDQKGATAFLGTPSNGFIGTTVSQAADKATLPIMPSNATFSLSGVTAVAGEAGYPSSSGYAGGATYDNPVIRVAATIVESNTPAMSTWAKQGALVTRKTTYVSGSPTNPTPTDLTTYTGAGSIITKGLFSGGAIAGQVVVSNNEFFDVALVIYDGQDNSAPVSGAPSPNAGLCVQIATNVNIPAVGGSSTTPGSRIGKIIGAGQFIGDTTGDKSTPISDGTQLTYTFGADVQTKKNIGPDGSTNASTPNLISNADFSAVGGTTGISGSSTGTVPQNYMALANGNACTFAADGTTVPPMAGTSWKLVYSSNAGGGKGLVWGGAWDGASAFNFRALTKYVFSFYAKASVASTVFNAVSVNDAKFTVTALDSTKFPSSYADTAWHRYAFLVTVGSVDALTTDILMYTATAGAASIWFADPQLEEGSVLSVWSGSLHQTFDLGLPWANKDLGNLNNRTADKITYTAGGTVDSLKPAAAGADVTGANTALDTTNVNGVGSALYTNRQGLAVTSNGAPPYVTSSNVVTLQSGVRVTRGDGTFCTAPAGASIPTLPTSGAGYVFMLWNGGSTATTFLTITQGTAGGVGTGFTATLQSPMYEILGSFRGAASSASFFLGQTGFDSGTMAALANVLVNNHDGTGAVTGSKVSGAVASATTATSALTASLATDTANVNGVAAATVSQGAVRANAVINGSNQIASSTPLNSQGSIAPFVTDINLTLGAPSGQTKITYSTNAGSIYRADGTAISVSAASGSSASGLDTSGTTHYYVAAVVAATTGTSSTMSFQFFTGTPTITQQQALLEDGFVVLISPASAPTPGSGGSGGGNGRRYL